jgi:hypothetical protein
MKKILYLFSLCALVFIGKANASTASLFELNESEVQLEMTDLNNLESYVELHQGITLNDLMQNVNLVQQFSLKSMPSHPFSPMFSFDDMAWFGFLWGFCCFPVGFIIYFVGDKEEEYLISVIIGFVLAVIIGGRSYIHYRGI